MIKKYFQFIKENKDNDNNIRIQDVYEKREHINHSELKKYLEVFEHNSYNFDFEDGVCNLESKKFIPYHEDSEIRFDTPIIPNVKYHYYTAFLVSITRNMEYNEEVEELEYNLGVIHRILKSKTGFEPFCKMIINPFEYEYVHLDKIKVLENGYFSNPGSSKGDEEIVVFIPTKEIGKVDTDSIINFYNWDVKKDNEDRVYLEKRYEEVVEYIPNEPLHNISARDLLKLDEEEMIDEYYSYNYNPDPYAIFNYYINNQNKKLLIDYVINNLDEDKITVDIDENEELYSQFNDRDIIDSLEGTDLLQEIENKYVSMDNMSHASKNYKELHNEFRDVIWEEANGEFLEKEDGTKFFKFYVSEDWFEYWEEQNYDLGIDGITVALNEYLESLSLKVNPRLSDYGSVDENYFNEVLEELIDEHS